MIEAETPSALLALFLSDATTHMKALRDGLGPLRENRAPDRSLLPDMQLAAHSIRGSAKIIGFETAAELAHALETLLEELDGDGGKLHPSRHGMISEVLDCFAQMVNTGPETLSRWAQQQRERMTQLSERIQTTGALRGMAEAPKTTTAGPRAKPNPSRVRPVAPVQSSLTTGGASIIDLFRLETAECTEVLSSGLVELESSGRADLESLMRAAHSIKGAARVVGIDVAVQVAHALEDCLVKAQNGQLALRRGAIDLLLEAVDLLAEIGRSASQDFSEWEAQRGGAVAHMLSCLHQLAQLRRSVPPPRPPSVAAELRPQLEAEGQTVGGVPEEHTKTERAISVVPVAPIEPVAVSPSPRRDRDSVAGDSVVRDSVARDSVALDSVARDSVVQARSRSTSAHGRQRDRVVRVNAQSINRLMGLAGESLVESRRMQTFGAALQRLRQRQSELGLLLESLNQQLGTALDSRSRSTLDDAVARTAECRSMLAEQMNELDSYAQRVDDLSDRLYREALKSRMRPFGDCAQGFPRMVRDVARQLDKEVRFVLVGETTDVDRDVLESLDAPLTHLLRNAVDHGLETPDVRAKAGKERQGVVRLEARHHAGMLAITVADDGRGIDPAALRAKIVERGLLVPSVAEELTSLELYEFIFLAGFSTASKITEISGRGVGLDAVRSMVEAASGVVRVTSDLGRGTTFHIQLPVTRSVMRAVVTEIAGEAYAFPLLRVERILRLAWTSVQTMGAVQYFVLEGENVSLVGAAQILGFSSGQTNAKETCVVVVGDRTRRYGVAVEKFLGEHDLVVRPLDERLGKVQDIAAAAILVDGSPALILDVDDLMRSIEKLAQTGRIDKLAASAERKATTPRKHVLVVDDSITVREVERQLLLNRGYDVDVAVDGIDGLNSARSTRYDLVVTDIDMPRMSGLELVRHIKQDPRLSATPVIIVSYKDREEDRMRGLDAGANYYLTKSSFHDETLVRAVEELIGAAGT